MASAVGLIRFSSMLQPNRFQLFQPIGGAVIGTTGVAAVAAAGSVAAATSDVAATVSAATKAARGLGTIGSNQ